MFIGDEMPRRKVDVGKAILNALSGKAMTWIGLLEEIKVSKGALSKHLNSLIDRKVVLTRIRETRPPQTVYYLADQPFVNVVLFLTDGMTKEQMDDFFDNILTGDVFEVLIESYEKILNLIQSKTFPLRIPIDNIFSIEKQEDLEKLHKIWEHPPHMNITLPQILNVDLDSMAEPEREAWESTIFSQITVQFILTIYRIEKLFLEPFPKEFRDKIQEKGDLGNTLVLEFIQKKNIWEEFDKFSEWWYKKISPKIPSSDLLGMLALRFYIETHA